MIGRGDPFIHLPRDLAFQIATALDDVGLLLRSRTHTGKTFVLDSLEAPCSYCVVRAKCEDLLKRLEDFFPKDDDTVPLCLWCGEPETHAHHSALFSSRVTQYHTFMPPHVHVCVENGGCKAANCDGSRP